MRFKMGSNNVFVREACLFCDSFDRPGFCIVAAYPDESDELIGYVCRQCLEVGAEGIKNSAIENAKETLEGAKRWLGFVQSQDFSGLPSIEEFEKLNKQFVEEYEKARKSSISRPRLTRPDGR